jgi:SAM-dependent methyltransferase
VTWNHNLHYHPLLLAAVPAGCERALDVGCGEGVLARKLRRLVPRVTGIDSDETSVELARALDQDGEIEYLRGDFLTHSFEPASFDYVVCVAALHHMDEAAALRRMPALLRPGGTLAVLGLPRPDYPRDLPRNAAAAVVTRAYRLVRQGWESPSPTVWPPALTFREVRALAAPLLPGASIRRHLLWRYSIVWRKP